MTLDKKSAHQLMMESPSARRTRLISTNSRAPELIPLSELAVANLQEAIVAHAAELRNRAQEGSASLKDMQAVAALSSAAAKLSAEQREQRAEMSLALNSDEDILTLLIDSVRALGPRGISLLKEALNLSTQEE